MDYRGEILVILYNTNDIPYYVKKDDRIAQAVLAKALQANFVWEKKLDETARGDGGLGSTGK
jgi:dUTP pyrophosphatase